MSEWNAAEYHGWSKSLGEVSLALLACAAVLFVVLNPYVAGAFVGVAGIALVLKFIASGAAHNSLRRSAQRARLSDRDDLD